MHKETESTGEVRTSQQPAKGNREQKAGRREESKTLAKARKACKVSDIKEGGGISKCFELQKMSMEMPEGERILCNM